ncbi:MAG: hypothetical protein JNL96_00830 [Planctomycetaceae bacterium]|nr:hypothetical protein [Planctomycetaceae bacterium]
MTSFIIIEVADGLTAVELPYGKSPEDTAAAQGGTLIDEGPFATLEEANDAIDNLEAEAEEEEGQA